MNRNKMLFKNNTQMVIYLIIFVFLIYAFIFLGTRNYNVSNKDDHEKFNNEFSLVDNENIFEYANNSQVRSIISNGNGIILFGTNLSKWTDYYAMILNETAKEIGIEKIYYYDFIKDREEKNGTYQSIVEKLSGYVKTNDLGISNIYSPTLLIIKNNDIIYFDDETSFTVGGVTPEKYWTEDKILSKKEMLKSIFKQYIGSDNNG